MSVTVEERGPAVVAWARGKEHRFYEDRFRLLPKSVPLVSNGGRGEVFAVFDGIGSAPMGMSAAQEMADVLVNFYRRPDLYQPSWNGLQGLLFQANAHINGWGFMEGTDRPLGGCAGTVAWIMEDQLTILHAGDTVGMLISGKNATQLTKIHERNGAIYRYFGLGSNLKIDVNTCRVCELDTVLLMSDGVTKVFHPMEAAGFLQKFPDIRQGARALAEASQAKGSPDDITVVLVNVGDYED